MPALKLNLGCGKTFKAGYINVDAFDESVADRVMMAFDLEFEDNTFTHVDCTQVLEHLGAAKSIYALAEVFRVLKPGGMLLIETPDLVSSFKTFLKGSEDQRSQVMNWIYGLDMPGMSHKYGFPEELLQRMLQEAGFTSIEISRIHTRSTQPSLRAISKKVDSEIHQLLSHLRKEIVRANVVDLDNQIDAIEKEYIIQEMVKTALSSQENGQLLRGIVRISSTSCPKIGEAFIELGIKRGQISSEDGSMYLRLIKELISLELPRVMTYLFHEMPMLPGQQIKTIETIKSMVSKSVMKLLDGEQMAIEEIRKTTGKIEVDIQTDLFSKVFLEMTSASHLALGAKEFALGHLETAETHYGKAMRFNRDSAEAYWNLARLKALEGAMDEARKYYKVTKDLIKLRHPNVQSVLCKRIDDELEYITNGQSNRINRPILSLYR